ncbi:Pickpocket protein 19 [Frankliniella fusca]|uniref:Pickpocket protein 19 n=1 Tax=Frankliniella fusca TaxID=407009 RepID=A0AAE1GRI9_9NEOP|nr:Pickpocket protein 19 [Frankliniella fusca]
MKTAFTNNLSRVPSKRLLVAGILPSKRIRALQNIGHGICNFSSIHGLRYLSKGTTLARFMWGLAIFISASATVGFMGVLWTLYATGTTEVRILSTRVPVYDRPFPAVYICPQVTFQLNATRQMLIKQMNLTHQLSSAEENGLGATTDVLNNLLFSKWLLIERSLKRAENEFGNKASVLDLIDFEPIMAFPKCRDWIVFCMWHASVIDCCSNFEFDRRVDVWCYVFNSNVVEENRKQKSCYVKSTESAISYHPISDHTPVDSET